jgi:nucleotide-binding universal stress UspA family protein
MIKKILVPTDGSTNSDIALEYGIYLARELAASITGLHVIDVNLLQPPMMTDISGTLGMPPSEGFFDAIETALNEKTDFILKDLLERCRKAGVETKVKKEIGKIEEIIVKEAQNADLILMAKKGEHFHLKEGGLLGSVSHAIVRHSGKPVLITPDRFLEIESIGIAYDGSPSAKKALDLALQLSKQTVWALTAVIISSDNEKASALRAQIEEITETQETECEVIIISGKESDEIIKYIREGAVELIVMGAYGHNRLHELLLGSTTSHIISKSPIPVLLTH